MTKLNCEVLYDGLALEVRWAVAGESIVMQLVGRVADGEYMSFGLSGSDSRSVMVGGDVVTAWLERDTGRGFAEDYLLAAKAQCQGGRGTCPDTASRGSNDVRLLNAALINDFTMLTFQRPLRAVDRDDRPIFTNSSQAVIWAVGPVNSQGHASYHTLRTRGNMFVDFGRTPQWNCPLPDDPPQSSSPQQSSVQSRQSASAGSRNRPQSVTPSPNAWYIPPIECHEPEDGVFYAQIGPTGGDNGYNAITGHVGWGIAYYINGLLIPEIHVVRGKSYTFVVESGYDEANPSRSHPLYITDDPEGGYEHMTPQERAKVQVFAGVEVDANNNPSPTSFGRLCEWKSDPDQPADAHTSFGAYQRTLKLDCAEGQPGILQWTPDANTPDTVYYQCYTHRFLGWKIHVHDSCDVAAQRSSIDYGDDYIADNQAELSTGSSTTRLTRIDAGAHGDGKVNFDHKLNTPGINSFSSRSDQSLFQRVSSQQLPTHRNNNRRFEGESEGANLPDFPGQSSRDGEVLDGRPRSWAESNIKFDFPAQFGKFDMEQEINSLRESLPFDDLKGAYVLEEHTPPRPPPTPKYAITHQYNYVDVNKQRQKEEFPINKFESSTSTDLPKIIGEMALSITKPPKTSLPSPKRSFVPNFKNDRPTVPLQENVQYVRNSLSQYSRNDFNGYEARQQDEISENTSQNDIRNDRAGSGNDHDIETPVPVQINTAHSSRGPISGTKHNTQGYFEYKPATLPSNSQGFQPETIVFESDFVPILTEDSPGPPSFVRDQHKHFKQSRESEHSRPHIQRPSSPKHEHSSHTIIHREPQPQSRPNIHVTEDKRVTRHHSSAHLREINSSGGIPPRNIHNRPNTIKSSELMHHPLEINTHQTISGVPHGFRQIEGHNQPRIEGPTITHVFTSEHGPEHLSMIKLPDSMGELQPHFRESMHINNESPISEHDHSSFSHSPKPHSIHRPPSLNIPPTHFIAENPNTLTGEPPHLRKTRGPIEKSGLENNELGLSSHFKSPQDPPATFSVHRIPISPTSTLIPGSQVLHSSGSPFFHPVPPVGALPPPAHLVPGARPFRNLRPIPPSLRRPNPHGPLRMRPRPLIPQNLPNGIRGSAPIPNFGPVPGRFSGSIGPASHGNRRLIPPPRRLSQHKKKSDSSRPSNRRMTPKRRASSGTKSKESFLHNIWSSLTGGSPDDGNAPQATPRLAA
ncbi:DOMON domain [Trinorchestia longiramus]|nr:DOMON domain [Trinorchestia longiramus]